MVLQQELDRHRNRPVRHDAQQLVFKGRFDLHRQRALKAVSGAQRETLAARMIADNRETGIEADPKTASEFLAAFVG